MSLFKEASVSRVKARLGFHGPAKSGKTWTSLAVMEHLLQLYASSGDDVGNGEVAVIDTENRASEKYAKFFKFSGKRFKVVHLNHYHPSNYLRAVAAAEKEGFFGLVIDQISHEWAGVGGILDQVGEVQANEKNQFTAWREPSAEHSRFFEALVNCRIHLICTMRSKVKYAIGKDRSVEKLGVKPIARQGTDYEFDAFFGVSPSHVIRCEGSRFHGLDMKSYVPDPDDRKARAREIAAVIHEALSEIREVGPVAEAVAIGLSTPDQAARLESALEAGGARCAAALEKRLGGRPFAAIPEREAEEILSVLARVAPAPAVAPAPEPPKTEAPPPGRHEAPAVNPAIVGSLLHLRSLLAIPDDAWGYILRKRGVSRPEDLSYDQALEIGEALESKAKQRGLIGDDGGPSTPPPPGGPPFHPNPAEPPPVSDAEFEAQQEALAIERAPTPHADAGEVADVIQESIVSGRDVKDVVSDRPKRQRKSK